MKKAIPRGQRNNNPFNIKQTTIDWKGESIYDNDKTFEEFKTMEFGLRAGLLLIRNYTRKGFNTIGSIITRFAPSSENDTASYIDYVCSKSGLHHNTVIVPDTENFFKVCQAIVKFESLLDISTSQLKTIYQNHNL